MDSALAAGIGLAGCGTFGGGTPAVTITSCGLDGVGSPEASYTLTNSTSQEASFYLVVGYYQDGTQFTQGNDDPDISANTTYTGQVDDSGQSPPNSLDPISCKVLQVENDGSS
jgi:hypothetical protein